MAEPNAPSDFAHGATPGVRGSPAGSAVTQDALLPVPDEADSVVYQAALRFDRAWNPAEPPRVTDFLPDGPARAAVALELALVDIERRRTAGLPADADEYLRAVPELAADPAAVGRLLAAAGAGSLIASGRYELGEEVGCGATGVVYRARDLVLDCAVALKVMQPEVAANPGAKERFLRAARAMAAVAHPRIVVVHQIGEWKYTPFLVMPLMKGCSLGRRLKNGPPVPLADAVRFTREAADGLTAAHARGLMHRNLKPDNVWLEESADGVSVRLLDFGLAGDETTDPGTSPGAAFGTPNYLSPEQLSGERVDGRADLFSLGCVLFELTTGEKAFRGESVAAVLFALANRVPPAPHTLNPAVPAPLSALIQRLLSKNRDERPASARDLAAMLKAMEAAPAAALPQQIGRYRVEKELGRGGFGLVYLAHDDQLHRPVAIKVPHPRLVARPDQAETYLTEARTVAALDHPHIVPVFDVGGTDQFPCFVVSKFIDGTDLAGRLKRDRLPTLDAVGLVATVAEALHHAHKHGLVHRDVKPGNILLDKNDRPFVADFGLALRERDAGTGPGLAGTPAYMSPEQARGEGHRVDGRSDVFSLGVVFYELLVGRRPFKADSQTDLLAQIASDEPRPPRQYDDAIPKELERICLKALSKRAAERYSTAKDLADDLRHFLARQPGPAPAGSSSAPPVLQPPSAVPDSGTSVPPVTPAAPASGSQPIRIVPKGLRSFDAHDADFFLELLPGPRDRDGLPDSVRFWRTRIEERDADQTFAVGLIYGPSGCGKSSLVKAGLLPRLAPSVTAVYVEATADDTEARLLNGLRKRCPALPVDLGLKETLAALRRGQGVPAGKKVTIVLDQFEQWLHANKDEQGTELVQALRQCDGGRVQCVVMVRDDFWMAATRFMRELEVRLVEAQNSAAVDLFSVRHAEKVLAAFGRAFGVLPDAGTELGGDQKEFLNRAVSGLAQGGKVISVRLALFAEMMKARAWTPATLREVGGTEGVGVAFLEETFGATTAPPEHRLHQKAARAVLKALLPDAGTDIKGHMRSYAELLGASGYGRRPTDFGDLVRILDGEIRLITPTDPDGKDGADEPAPPTPAGTRHYQLTHDYLVAPLRDWLTRKQKETRRGRAELLLVDRAAVWNARPENRQLPSLVQWFGIRWLTAKQTWTPPQRKMMRTAGRYHALRGAVVMSCLVTLGVLGWEGNGRLQARTLRDRLSGVPTAETPAVVKDMAPYRRWVDPLLREEYAQAEAQKDARRQLHASLALLPADAGQVDYLCERLLTGDPAEVAVIRAALSARKDDLTERLWAVLENPQTDPNRRLRAACALSTFTPDDPRWEKVGGDVAAVLVAQKPFVIAPWTDALKGAGRWLIPPLAGFLVDEDRSVPERGLIASVYGTYAPDVPGAYARLEDQLAEAAGGGATLERKLALAKRQASVGVALLVVGKGAAAWPLLKHRPDPTVRSYLIERLAPGGVDPNVLLSRLEEEKDVSARRALLLSLGEYGLDRVPAAEWRKHLPRLLEVYRDDPDPGVHGAAGWLLRQWQELEQMKAVDASLATGKVEGKRQWYLNRQGQTMAVIPTPGEFWMGENSGDKSIGRHKRRIDRSFALASQEVTVEQFLRFRKEHDYEKAYARTGDCPVNLVAWYDAAAYCNWLSEREGVPKDQWCYEPNEAGKYAEGMSTAPDYLKRTGYRLPTEAEWEYACRAGSGTEYASGGSVELLGKYGWCAVKSLGESHPVASLKSNDLGLFDLHGNVWEWCQDAYREYPTAASDAATEENDNVRIINSSSRRVLRGGSFGVRPPFALSAYRTPHLPAYLNNSYGFRPARTFSP